MVYLKPVLDYAKTVFTGFDATISNIASNIIHCVKKKTPTQVLFHISVEKCSDFQKKFR